MNRDKFPPPEEPPRGPDGAPLPAERRPYRRPELRQLGSVRELALGSAAGMVEGAGTFRLGM